jgi:hypothetical protein
LTSFLKCVFFHQHFIHLIHIYINYTHSICGAHHHHHITQNPTQDYNKLSEWKKIYTISGRRFFSYFSISQAQAHIKKPKLEFEFFPMAKLKLSRLSRFSFFLISMCYYGARDFSFSSPVHIHNNRQK